MVHRKKLTAEQALQRAKLYCAYQERCHAETKKKLYSFGLFKSDVDRIVSNLIEEDYLNEERFAAAFARGKFRMKHWGRVKIAYELKQKNVSEYCIRKAVKQIAEDEYLEVLGKLAGDKLKELNDEKSEMMRRKKVHDYLLQKGYERDLIFSIIDIIKE
jgi:regulatory protein